MENHKLHCTISRNGNSELCKRRFVLQLLFVTLKHFQNDTSLGRDEWLDGGQVKLIEFGAVSCLKQIIIIANPSIHLRASICHKRLPHRNFYYETVIDQLQIAT